MTAHEYLKQIRVLATKIKQLEEQIEYLKNAASGVDAIRYDKDRVQTSIEGSPMEARVVDYVELERELADKIDQMAKLRQDIIHWVQSLTDDRYVSVLFKRYVELKSYELIAVETNYSFEYVKELHGNAIKALEKSSYSFPPTSVL